MPPSRAGSGCRPAPQLEGHRYAEVARRSGYALNEVMSHIQNGKRSLKILRT
jgi:DNA-directed RNA polymerase specialized sigma24 family protein